MFELFNISLWSVLTKVAKHELCEGKQKLVLGEMFKFGFRHKREISLLFYLELGTMILNLNIPTYGKMFFFSSVK